MRHDFKIWIQANLMCFGCILLLKTMVYVNPELHESFNLWWTMIIPTVALIAAQPLRYFAERSERKQIK